MKDFQANPAHVHAERPAAACAASSKKGRHHKAHVAPAPSRQQGILLSRQNRDPGNPIAEGPAGNKRGPGTCSGPKAGRPCLESGH